MTFTRDIEQKKHEFLVISVNKQVDIGAYQIYLYPADSYDQTTEKNYHQVIVTEFNKDDFESSHKCFYMEEGKELILPLDNLEEAVKELFQLPEYSKL